MATGKEWSCPICCDARDDVAYAMPCDHRFCLGCILRWAERNPACPLCRRSILTVKLHEVQREENNLHPHFCSYVACMLMNESSFVCVGYPC
uniref:RING-type domain-containing protein n=1 Tax=Ficedula albicollis TaxID=59894 RepID=U3KL87_FICAL